MAKTPPKKLIAPPTNKIALGDCIKRMQSWEDDCLDLVFADPPYNIGFSYDQYKDTLDDDKYITWTKDWIHECTRLLKPSGSMYILIGDEYAAETRLILKDLEKQGKLLFRNWIVWHYTFGQNCQAKFNRSHAHLFYCVGSGVFPKLTPSGQSPKTLKPKFTIKDFPFTFNKQAIAIPSARQTTYNDKRAAKSGKLPDDTWYLRPQEATGTYFKPEEDTWFQSRLCGTFKERETWHPCQLPEALLHRVIKLSSNKNDLVFDPFAGSGTTLAVANKLDRQFLGCELSKDYVQRAMKRIKQSTKPAVKTQTPQPEKVTS